MHEAEYREIGSPGAGDIQKHLNATYHTLRWGLGWIAVAFPFVLVIGGMVYIRDPEQLVEGSMSAYYHAEHAGRSMRNWFVGTLFALGALLHIYKGFTPKENFLLDAAGLLAVGVAVRVLTRFCPKTEIA